MPAPPHTRSALAHVRRLLRTGGYSERTEKTYLAWIERFLGYHRHPELGVLGRDHASSFLGSLAAAGLSAKTRNQAASALSFLYRYLLDSDAMSHVMRARGRPRLPTVLSHDEARAVLRELRGRVLLVASLLYGTGLRLNEALTLRVKDLDFDLRRITVREGKGGVDRVVMMPVSLEPELRAQLRRVRQIHEEDRALGGGWAPLPAAMHRKSPRDGFDLAWQFLFPAARMTVDPKTEHRGRGPSHPSQFQRSVKLAVRRAGITKPATCHTFRHSFATQLLRDGYDVRIVQELLGHKDLRTTMVYLHVADGIGIAVRSPLDRDESGRTR